MPSVDWQVVAEVATTVSTVAFAASTIMVVLQLRQAGRERYFSITAHLFEIWQSPEFQHDQLFLRHKLASTSWQDFCAGGRGEHAERAIHRVGGYYDRVGNLVRHCLIRKDDILPTIGGYAVAVWYRIEPLVKELRLRENAILFENYEALLPECRECYVLGIEQARARAVTPAANNKADAPVFSNGATTAPPVSVVEEDRATRVAPSAANHSEDPAIPEVAEFSLPDTDGVVRSLSEFTSSLHTVLIYVRGAWCPFCLRQLADYAERYRDFKQAGIEVVAISPESIHRSRRMRTRLKLPFAVLSDRSRGAARSLGLIGYEKPGEPAPATVVLDSDRHVSLSTFNQREKCLLAADILEYMRAYGQKGVSHAVSAPELATPKPGMLLASAVGNMAAGLVIR